MILTVFIIAVALGAETEFKIVTVLLGTSADCTFMFGDIVHLPGLAFESLSSVYFGRRYIFVIPSSEKENNKAMQLSLLPQRNRWLLSDKQAVLRLLWQAILS